MIEYVPGYTANEVTWTPTYAATRSFRRDLTVRRGGERSQNCLPGLLELIIQVIHIALLEFPANLI